MAALAAGTTASVPALAVGGAEASHPDAELLRPGAEFDRLHMAWLPLKAEADRLDLAYVAEARKMTAEAGGLNLDLWMRWGEEAGVNAAVEAEERAFEHIDAVTAKIREMAAKTFAGLAVKARALRMI